MTANGYDGSLLLVPIVVAGRLHMLPKRNAPKYAITLEICIRKDERMDVLVSSHAEAASCAVILEAWLRRGTCCSIMA